MNLKCNQNKNHRKPRLQLYIIQYILVYTTKSKINKVNVEALNLTNWFLCFVRKQKPFEYLCYHWGSSDKEKRLGFIIFEVPSPVYDVKWMFRRHYHDIYALCSFTYFDVVGEEGDAPGKYHHHRHNQPAGTHSHG